jgi:hypothetical protein
MDRSNFYLKIAITIAASIGGIAAKPPTSAQKFDLVCRLHERFVRELHPENTGVWAMPTESQRGNVRFSVDLDSRKIRNIDATNYCAKHVCNLIEKTSDTPIRRVNRRYIVVLDDLDQKWSIRRKDGWFESHHPVSPYLTQLTTGTCRKARFSGFPAKAPRLVLPPTKEKAKE